MTFFCQSRKKVNLRPHAVTVLEIYIRILEPWNCFVAVLNISMNTVYNDACDRTN